MQKIILRIAVFAWVLASTITWADGILYVHKPGESFQGVQAVPRNYIDYSRYLSPAVEIDSGRQFAQAEIAARLRARTPFDEAAPASEQTFKVLFLPQDQYEEMLAFKASPQASATAFFLPSGNIRCNIRTDTPHFGEGQHGYDVPKAKSWGNCSFTHTGPGASPPSLTVWLEQTLYRLGNYGQIMSGQPAGAARPAGIWKAIHSRTGLNPPKLAWNDRKAQVYGKCPKPSDPAYNGANYTHSDRVWIIAPPGWAYIGPNPLSVGIEKRKYFKCWK